MHDSQHLKAVQPSVGPDFEVKEIHVQNGDLIKAIVWDTVGGERYQALAPAFYRHAFGALVVFDLTDHTSFKKVSRWINEVKSKADKGCEIVLIGNKVDLCTSEKVTKEIKPQPKQPVDYSAFTPKNTSNLVCAATKSP